MKISFNAYAPIHEKYIYPIFFIIIVSLQPYVTTCNHDLFSESVESVGEHVTTEYVVRTAWLHPQQGWRIPGRVTSEENDMYKLDRLALKDPEYVERIRNRVLSVSNHFKGLRTDCGTVREKSARCADSGQFVIKRNFCYQKDCPVCYMAWARKQAAKAAQRVYAFEKPVYHWTVTIPEDSSNEHIEKTRKFIMNLLSGKKVLYNGFQMVRGKKKKMYVSACDPQYSLMFFHYYRLKEYEFKDGSIKVYEPGPHWHIITTLSFLDTERIAGQEDVNFIKLRDGLKILPEEMMNVIAYELSHYSYLDSTKHAYQWLGLASYSKMKVVQDNVKILVQCTCDTCREKLLNQRANLEKWQTRIDEEEIEISDKEFNVMSKITFIEKLGMWRSKQYVCYPKKYDRVDAIKYLSRFWNPNQISEIIDKFKFR